MNLKRHATPIVLLIITIALGAWLWFDRDKVTEGERKRRENNVFVAWRRDELTKIEISHNDETIVLTHDAKSDSSWRMTSPREERVDTAAMERLLTTLEFATVVRKVDEQQTTLGFEYPRATGSITMGALVMHFALGAVSPRPEGSSYFKVDNGAPFVASRELTEALLQRSDAIRDRTVIPYLSLELSRFEIKHKKGGFVLDRADDRSFKIQGLNVFASRNALDKVWSALAEMRAEAFPKDADADRLTSSPQLTITMTPKEKDKPVGELVVGDACPGHPNDVVVLRTKPTRVAACAPRGAIESLFEITPNLLVDKRPFAFRADEIEELRLERLDVSPADGGGSVGGSPRAIEVARRGSGFHEREPVDRELDGDEADAVNDLLAHIEHDTADDVRANNGAPFHAIARARVHSGEHDEIIEVGDAALRRARDDALLTTSAGIRRRLLPQSVTLRAHKLQSEGVRAVTRVLLKCGTTQELVDSDGSGLKLVEPRGFETDRSIVQLIDGLLKGKVNAWVSDSDDGTFGISHADTSDSGACRIVISFADGNAPLTVRLGAEGEGGVYGSIDGHPEVFVISGGLAALAHRIYVSHASMRAEPSQIESVRVLVNDKVVSAARDPAELREAAGRLYADRVLTVGSSDVGKPEVEVDIALVEAGGGPKRKITCGPVVTIDGQLGRRCAVNGVKAVFELLPSQIDGLISSSPQPDAGPVLRDR